MADDHKADGFHRAQRRDDIVHDEVEKFVMFFHSHLKDRNLQQLQVVYEVSFPKLTDRYYKASSWPNVGAIAPLVNNDEVFLMLYRELYFRHVYSKMNPSLQQRFDSFENYCSLFNFLLRPDGALELPIVWLWDMLDEFVFQFQSFCQYRGKAKNRSLDERQMLKANQKVWDVAVVIRFLAMMMDKSDIVRYLHLHKSDNENDLKFDMLRSLGYFSLVALSRVHVLIGDYHTALALLDPIDVSRKGFHQRIPSCTVTLHYYLGFAYLMHARFKDATRTFTNILTNVSRSKQFQQRQGNLDLVVKLCDKMHALIAISTTLAPQRIDENIDTIIREKFSDKLIRLQQGQESAFEEFFSVACPKFVVVTPTLYDEQGNYGQEEFRAQLKRFLAIVKQYSVIPTLRSFLKLYTTIPTAKLADFLELSESDCSTELLNWKLKNNELHWQTGPVSSGSRQCAGDVQFWVANDMVHVRIQRPARRQADYFITHITKMEGICNDRPMASRPADGR